MPTLFCFGLGYTARHVIADRDNDADPIVGTVRDAETARRISRDGIGGKEIQAIAFDSAGRPLDIAAELAAIDLLLVSVPPDQRGDPVLHCFADALARSPRLAAIVYLSTVGVYGDYRGAWVDESSEPRPVSERGRARLEAERAWTTLAVRTGKALAILRLAGIYGPSRNALVQVTGLTAKRIAKPGQVFNHIHVADIAAIINTSLDRRANGIFNVADDEPTPPGEPIRFAAELLGLAPPPEVRFEEAARTMSPMALSFYGESKRVRNDKIKRELGVRLRYPTYREGLTALFAAGDHHTATTVAAPARS
jgi:dTDP-4-dehydrorhamnose reductase